MLAGAMWGGGRWGRGRWNNGKETHSRNTLAAELTNVWSHPINTVLYAGREYRIRAGGLYRHTPGAGAGRRANTRKAGGYEVYAGVGRTYRRSKVMGKHGQGSGMNAVCQRAQYGMVKRRARVL